ncbi:hypothetical protein C465_06853 [Halorubrum distributum JCM 9100]|uniref:Uncharacterized protein n=5 Tax=Halorubrum distributum TaxID=29283 RepID=M0EQ67_9EURY|nr:MULTISPECIES: hypothetical protein [Halorubrum distributum group]ELZ32732.1 hypothetical protein C473_08527 [Halorubrum terrestre JCM 10247]ELZ49941.1 hypothetical protein C465_06853 [Halorubrum distributum JCM 9100]ELZ57006.1 hypothetical protein C466_02884 [Halorubrum distributum JCM 10118]EMA58528.1 hypothetical protein C470_12098 [Halorubrum litoreum JCM 13561]MYL17022.1 hypothetical protein [Halorubrum terrestre]
MPSKRTFAKRLAALAATGLGVGGPIEALTSEPPPDATLAVEPAATGAGASDGEPTDADPTSGRDGAGADGPRSAVAAGTYDPAAAASNAVDTVVTGRVDPAVLTATGLPSGVGSRLRRLLDRYESVSLAAARQATGGAALTADGLEGCAVAVGDVDAAALAAELDADPAVTREADDGSGFARFRARGLGSAVGVAPGELVAAYGPTAAVAAAHRDAGIGGGVDGGARRRAGTSASYGPLPSLLEGDATVCVDLGPDARDHLRSVLADAPDELRTAVDASGAVGASLRVTGGESATGGADPGDPSVALRYGAVADPRRLDRETAEAIARAAREGETSLADASVTRHGRTVIVDGAAESDLFAAHASLFDGTVGDPIEVADA